MKSLRCWILAAALLALWRVDAELLDLISPHEDNSVLNHGMKGDFLHISPHWTVSVFFFLPPSVILFGAVDGRKSILPGV